MSKKFPSLPPTDVEDNLNTWNTGDLSKLNKIIFSKDFSDESMLLSLLEDENYQEIKQKLKNDNFNKLSKVDFLKNLVLGLRQCQVNDSDTQLNDNLMYEIGNQIVALGGDSSDIWE
jgi:hypothetical protein